MIYKCLLVRTVSCFSEWWGECDNDCANRYDLASFPSQETTEKGAESRDLGTSQEELCKNFNYKNLNIKLKKQMHILKFPSTSTTISLSEDTCFIENSEKCLFASKSNVFGVLTSRLLNS